MKLTSLVFPASLCLLLATARAADPASPIDPAARNQAFAPAATATASKQVPTVNASVQNRRSTPPVLDRRTSPLTDRRAAIDVDETRSKTMREKNATRPEAAPMPANAWDRRAAKITTAADVVRPPRVARFQDSLAAASASNLSRFPAVGGATTAKINRFVFRRNPEPSVGTSTPPVTRAAGGGAPVP